MSMLDELKDDADQETANVAKSVFLYPALVLSTADEILRSSNFADEIGVATAKFIALEIRNLKIE